MLGSLNKPIGDEKCRQAIAFREDPGASGSFAILSRVRTASLLAVIGAFAFFASVSPIMLIFGVRAERTPVIAGAVFVLPLVAFPVFLCSVMLQGLLRIMSVRRGAGEDVLCDNRLRAFSHARDLARFQSEIADQSFSQPHLHTTRFWEVMETNIVPAVAYVTVLGWVAYYISGNPPGSPGPIALRAVVLLGPLLIVFFLVKRVYFRVSPGLLEVMTFSIGGVKGTVCHSIPLDEATIEYRAGRSVQIERSVDGKRRIFNINYPRRSLVVSLFAAALCEQTAPRLPQDTLLG